MTISGRRPFFERQTGPFHLFAPARVVHHDLLIFGSLHSRRRRLSHTNFPNEDSRHSQDAWRTRRASLPSPPRRARRRPVPFPEDRPPLFARTTDGGADCMRVKPLGANLRPLVSAVFDLPRSPNSPRANGRDPASYL